jgi:hypothetical protein
MAHRYERFKNLPQPAGPASNRPGLCRPVARRLTAENPCSPAGPSEVGLSAVDAGSGFFPEEPGRRLPSAGPAFLVPTPVRRRLGSASSVLRPWAAFTVVAICSLLNSWITGTASVRRLHEPDVQQAHAIVGVRNQAVWRARVG